MARLGANSWVLLFGLLACYSLGSEVVTLNDDADSNAAPWHVGPPRRSLQASPVTLGESRMQSCKSCGQMAKVYGIVHTTEGKPPAWGKANSHAKGCWIAMDCNMAGGLGEDASRSAPGLKGFYGQVPVNTAPNSQNDRLENGMISEAEAAYKPVEAEMDYRTYNQIDWEAIVNQTMFSTVQVRIVGQTWDWTTPQYEPPSAQWSGTAWFIDHSDIGDGNVVEDSNELLLITNAHVAADSLYSTIMVPSAGAHSIEVEVVGACVKRDLAMLRIKDPSQLYEQVSWTPRPLRLSNSDDMKRAGQVMVLGYPLGLAGVKASMGFVSGYQQFEEQLYLQVTAPIDGGNSGGPLLNNEGDVIGVVSAKIAKASGMSFAIPSVELKALLEVLYKRRTVLLPYTGIPKSLTTTRHAREYFGVADNSTDSKSGLLIESVPPFSLLHQAMILPGDVLLSVDGASVDRFSEVWVDPIEDRVHFDTFLARKPFFETLALEVWRGEELKRFEITYDSTPEFAVPRIPETVVAPPKFVSFGGVAMMNLTYNIVESMINSRLAKYVDPAERENPAVVIVGVTAESPAGIDGSISPGFLVSQVNGQPVQTIQDVCDSMQGDGEWVTIHTDRGMVIFTREEVDQHECASQFAVANQLCQWSCPQPEEPEAGDQDPPSTSGDESGEESGNDEPPPTIPGASEDEDFDGPFKGKKTTAKKAVKKVATKKA